jgi:hypothetical protein
VTSRFTPPGPPQEFFDRHREALKDFNNVYVDFLEHPDDALMRERAMRLSIAATAATDAAGVRAEITPPAVSGGYVLTTLAQIAFAHEQDRNRGFRYSGDPTPSITTTFDVLTQADAKLERQAEQAAARRRNPLRWLEWAVACLLGFPGYLVALIVEPSWERASSQRKDLYWWIGLAGNITSIVAFYLTFR